MDKPFTVPPQSILLYFRSPLSNKREDNLAGFSDELTQLLLKGRVGNHNRQRNPQYYNWNETNQVSFRRHGHLTKNEQLQKNKSVLGRLPTTRLGASTMEPISDRMLPLIHLGEVTLGPRV
jgi:hypothetical protein